MLSRNSLFVTYFPYFLIGLSIFLVFKNSLDCDFTFDDTSAIVLNRYVHTNETIWWKIFDVDYWGTPIKSEHSHKSYRPLTSLTFRWNYFFANLDPYDYHFTNLILHLLVSFICYKFILIILGSQDVWPAILFTLFFACHPVKSEAVTSIVGRAELLSTFFFLISLFCYSRSAYLSFGSFVILASLSKEQGMTTPCVCMILEFIKIYLHYQSLNYLPFWSRISYTFRHTSFIKLFCLILFSLSIIVVRFHVMGSAMPIFTKFDNPASFEETPIRQLTYNYLLTLNLKLMLYPQWLCADWTMNSVPLVKDFYDPRNIWTVLFYSTAFILFGRALFLLTTMDHPTKREINTKRANLIIALVLIVIPFIPASNLLFPVGFVIAERVLYTPSIGYSLLLAIGWIRIRDRFTYKFVKILLNISTIFMLFSLSTKTYKRNSDWKSDLTLFKSGLKVNPNNAKLYNNIGHYYERKSQYDEAIKYFQMASKKDYEDIGSELNIARSLIRLNRLKEAEELLWNIKPRVRNSVMKNRMVPHYLNIWINLAHVISLNETRLHEAENLYLEVISIKSNFIDAYINLGELYIRKSLYDQALDTYQRALDRAEFISDMKTADLYYNIAIAKSLKVEQEYSTSSLAKRTKLFSDIAANLARAIDINREHKEALINLAILLQKPEFPRENQTMYREFIVKALKDYPKSDEIESFQFNIAITLLDLGGPNNRLDAIKHFKRAAEIKPDYRSASYNLALLYYDFKDYNSSLFYLNQTLAHHSNYTKALLLIADIYSRMGRIDDTEKTYTRVLEKEKYNYEALHNLCLIYKKTQRKKEIEKCRLMLNDVNFKM